MIENYTFYNWQTESSASFLCREIGIKHLTMKLGIDAFPGVLNLNSTVLLIPFSYKIGSNLYLSIAIYRLKGVLE